MTALADAWAAAQARGKPKTKAERAALRTARKGQAPRPQPVHGPDCDCDDCILNGLLDKAASLPVTPEHPDRDLHLVTTDAAIARHLRAKARGPLPKATQMGRAVRPGPAKRAPAWGLRPSESQDTITPISLAKNPPGVTARGAKILVSMR